MSNPTLTAIPDDSIRRSEYLETVRARPDPESRRRMRTEAKEAERVLGVVAAVLAGFLSATAYDEAEANGVVGIGFSIDESLLFEEPEKTGSRQEATKQAPDSRDEQEVDGGNEPKNVPLPWLPRGR